MSKDFFFFIVVVFVCLFFECFCCIVVFLLFSSFFLCVFVVVFVFREFSIKIIICCGYSQSKMVWKNIEYYLNVNTLHDI